jgi:hypothetical protein
MTAAYKRARRSCASSGDYGEPPVLFHPGLLMLFLQTILFILAARGILSASVVKDCHDLTRAFFQAYLIF